MYFSVVAGIENAHCPMFLTRHGQWTNNTNEMEQFSSMVDAIASLNEIVKDNVLSIHVEFSGHIRTKYGAKA